MIANLQNCTQSNLLLHTCMTSYVTSNYTYHVIVVTLLLVWLAPAVCPYKVSLRTQTPTPLSTNLWDHFLSPVGWSHTSTLQRSPSLMCTHLISHPDTPALIVMILGSYTTGDYKKWTTTGCGLTYLQLAVYLVLLWLQVRQSLGMRLLSTALAIAPTFSISLVPRLQFSHSMFEKLSG